MSEKTIPYNAGSFGPYDSVLQPKTPKKDSQKKTGTIKVALNTESSYFKMSLAGWRRYLELSEKPLVFVSDDGSTEIDITKPLTDTQEMEFPYCEIYIRDEIYAQSSETIPLNVTQIPFEPSRRDPAFIQTIEELGSQAETELSKFKIIEIPDDVDWRLVSDYDYDCEYIEEIHRTWR